MLKEAQEHGRKSLSQGQCFLSQYFLIDNNNYSYTVALIVKPMLYRTYDQLWNTSCCHFTAALTILLSTFSARSLAARLWLHFTDLPCWIYNCVCEVIVTGVTVREMRSKLFFSSGLCFTWQVRRLSLAGGLLAWDTEKPREEKTEREESTYQLAITINSIHDPNTTF